MATDFMNFEDYSKWFRTTNREQGNYFSERELREYYNEYLDVYEKNNPGSDARRKGNPYYRGPNESGSNRDPIPQFGFDSDIIDTRTTGGGFSYGPPGRVNFPVYPQPGEGNSGGGGGPVKIPELPDGTDGYQPNPGMPNRGREDGNRRITLPIETREDMNRKVYALKEGEGLRMMGTGGINIREGGWNSGAANPYSLSVIPDEDRSFFRYGPTLSSNSNTQDIAKAKAYNQMVNGQLTETEYQNLVKQLDAGQIDGRSMLNNQYPGKNVYVNNGANLPEGVGTSGQPMVFNPSTNSYKPESFPGQSMTQSMTRTSMSAGDPSINRQNYQNSMQNMMSFNNNLQQYTTLGRQQARQDANRNYRIDLALAQRGQQRGVGPGGRPVDPTKPSPLNEYQQRLVGQYQSTFEMWSNNMADKFTQELNSDLSEAMTPQDKAVKQQIASFLRSNEYKEFMKDFSIYLSTNPSAQESFKARMKARQGPEDAVGYLLRMYDDWGRNRARKVGVPYESPFAWNAQQFEDVANPNKKKRSPSKPKSEDSYRDESQSFGGIDPSSYGVGGAAR